MERLGKGDPRVEARGVALFEGMVSHGSSVLHTLCADRAQEVAAQRWLSSPRVSVPGIVEAGVARTGAVCSGRRIVAIQDTTEVNFKRWAGRRGLGPGGNGKTPGFFIHAVIAVDADDEAVAGLVDARIWTRGPDRVDPRSLRTLEGKESVRWLEGQEAAAELLGSASQIIMVADQEADIWSGFVRCPAGVDQVIRARHDRPVEGGSSLYEAARDWVCLTRYDVVVVPRGVGEKARTATVEVRAGTLRLKRPASADKADPEILELRLVEAREVSVPPPGKEALLWRILTTLPVGDAASACEVVRFYKLRWRIEEVFRTAKSDGLNLEASQVQDARHLFRLSALAMLAAVRILQLVDARDGSNRSMADVLDPVHREAVALIGKTREGSTKAQKNAFPEGSLAWLAWIVARHGGWNCYGKPPGTKTMAQGWKRLSAILEGINIARQLP